MPAPLRESGGMDGHGKLEHRQSLRNLLSSVPGLEKKRPSLEGKDSPDLPGRLPRARRYSRTATGTAAVATAVPPQMRDWKNADWDSQRLMAKALGSPGVAMMSSPLPPSGLKGQMSSKIMGGNPLLATNNVLHLMSQIAKPLTVRDAVKFGDDICLTNLEEGGLLGCNSMLFDSLSVHAQHDFDPSLAVHMQEECCFQILQKFQLSAAKTLDKLFQLSGVKDITTANWRSKIHVSSPLYREIRTVTKLVAAEQETNELESKRMIGELVAYGSIVQLRHRISRKFVTQTKNRAEHDSSAMEVALMEGGTEGSWWKVLPADKLRSEGEWVHYGDRVQLENIKHRNSYITISAATDHSSDEEGYPSLQRAMLDISNAVLHTTTKTRFEVNASPFISQFQIVPFRTVPAQAPAAEESRPVQGLDMITLYHRESERLLIGVPDESCARWMPASAAQIEGGAVHPGALWKVQSRYLELGGGPIPLKGSKVVLQHVLSGMYLSAKHGCSALVADLFDESCLWSFSALREDEDGSIAPGQLVWLTSELEAMSWLSIESEGGENARSSSSDSDDRRPRDVARSQDALLRTGAWLENEDLMEINAVSHAVFLSVSYVAQCKVLFDGFIRIILRADPFLANGHAGHSSTQSPASGHHWEGVPTSPLLAVASAASAASSTAGEHVNTWAWRRSSETLDGPTMAFVLSHPVYRMFMLNNHTIVSILDRLVCSCTLCSETNPFKAEGPPNVEQQNLLRQTGFLESAMLLVQSLNEDLHVPFENLKEQMPVLHEVVRRCFLLVERACIDNVENKKSMLEHVPMMQQHIELKVGAYFTLMVICSDTRELLESVSEERFADIVQGMRTVKSDLWARFLVQTCHERDQPIRKNQNTLTQLLLIQSPELIFRTTITNDDVVLSSDLGDMPNLAVMSVFADGVDEEQIFRVTSEDVNLLHNSDKQQPHELFRYHITMLELLGWLVHGRNPWAREVLAVNASRFGLEYNQLFRILGRREMPYAFRTMCCELIIRLYVDQDPHQAVQFLQTTRMFQQCLKTPDRRRSGGGAGAPPPQSSPSIPFQDQGFMRLKAAVVTMVQDFHVIDALQTRRNVFFNRLVDLVHALVQYGFYHFWDADTLHRSLRFNDVAALCAELMQALDARTDRNAHFLDNVTIEGDLVIEGKVKILQLVRIFFQCSDNERITDLMDFWNECCRRFDPDVHSWESKPPWDPTDVKSLAERIYGNEYEIIRTNVHKPQDRRRSSRVDLRDVQAAAQTSLHAEAGAKRTDHSFHVDEWTKIILNLIRFRSHALKELAFRSLISQSNRSSELIEAALGIQIVYNRKLAEIFMEADRQVDLLRDQVKYIVGSHDTRTQESLSAHKIWLDILGRWSELCTVTLFRTNADVSEVQTALANLGAVEVVSEILRLPMDRMNAQAPGQLDRPVDVQQRDLFNAVYVFLAKVCNRNVRNQTMLLPWLDLYCSHLGIEGLDVEEALSALVRDNAEMVALKGRRWIRMFFEDVMAKYRCRRPQWLDALHAVIRVGDKAIKENQALTMVLFRRYESVAAVFIKTPADWDRRAENMAADSDEKMAWNGSMLRYNLAVINLLSVCCEGKNPAAEVYAARYIPLTTAIKGVVGPNVRSSGTAVDVSPALLYRVKAVHLNFLHDVYSQTNVTRLIQDLHRKDNGFWSFSKADSKNFRGCLPLMVCIRNDLYDFVQKLKLERSNLAAGKGVGRTPSSQHDDDQRMREYFYCSVFQFLSFYYKARYSAVRGTTRTDTDVSKEIFDAVSEFWNLQLEREQFMILVNGEVVDGKVRAKALLEEMVMRAHIGKMTQKFNLREPPKAVQSAFSAGSFASDVSIEEVRPGFCALCEAVAGEGWLSDPSSVASKRVRSLAFMFSRDGDVELSHAGGTHVDRPSFDELLMDIMDLCNDARTDPRLLTNILLLIRAGMYLYEPHGPDRLPVKTIEMIWDNFMGDNPMTKFYGPEEQVLTWLQHKYDALGSTEAALRLCSHQTPEVRINATRLLLTLLQSGNVRIQTAICKYFDTTKDTSFFKTAHDTISLCMEQLKDFKKTLKRLGVYKGRYELEALMEEDVPEKSQPASLAVNMQFGRQSEVMLTLRLMQLMCEGQFRPMQDKMQKQLSDNTSYDLLRKCIDFIEAIQPMVISAVQFNAGNIIVLCMQVVETISEAVQGPNLKNQKYLLSSKFLAVVNRFLSTLLYTPLQEGMQAVHGMTASMNDLKCWLKTSLLNCCLAIMEGVGDEKRSSRALEFFELRNIELQMISIGNLLGIVEIEPTPAQHLPIMQSQASTDEGYMPSAHARRRQSSSAGRFGKRPSIALSCSSFEGMYMSRGWETALESELFALYFLLVSISEHDTSGTINEFLGYIENDQPKLYQHLTTHSSHVELTRMNDAESRTEKVYFRMEPKVIELTSNLEFKARTDKFIFDVPRENPQEKASVFLKKSKQVLLMVSLLRHFTVSDNYGLFKFFFQRRDLVDSWTRRLAVAITLCLLLFYGIPVDPNTGRLLGDGKFFTVGHTEPWYKDECYAHAGRTSHPDDIGASLASIMDYNDLSLKHRVLLKSRWASQAEWQAFPLGRHFLLLLAFLHVCATTINSITQLTLDFPLLYRECMETPGPKDDRSKGQPARGSRGGAVMTGYKKNLEPMPPMHSLQSRVIFSGQMRTLLMRSVSSTWYLAFKLCLSLLGFYNSPFFYPVYLLDYFRSKLGHMVLKAVMVGGPNLFRSFVLSMIVIVCFGFNSYAFFSQSVNVNQHLCHSPFQCVVKHILDSMTGDLTTVVGNDHGDFAYPSVAPWADLWHTFRYVTVFFSLFFWVFLLMGIMQGQIIDAFAEMRDKDQAESHDLSNNCFISSINRHSFSGYPGEWEKRKDGKFAWNYLHYFCYLQQKDPEEYSGLENTVSEAYAQGNTGFLPIGTFYAGQHGMEDGRISTHDVLESYQQQAGEKFARQERALAVLKDKQDEATRAIRDTQRCVMFMQTSMDQQTDAIASLTDTLKTNAPAFSRSSSHGSFRRISSQDHNGTSPSPPLSTRRHGSDPQLVASDKVQDAAQDSGSDADAPLMRTNTAGTGTITRTRRPSINLGIQHPVPSDDDLPSMLDHSAPSLGRRASLDRLGSNSLDRLGSNSLGRLGSNDETLKQSGSAGRRAPLERRMSDDLRPFDRRPSTPRMLPLQRTASQEKVFGKLMQAEPGASEDVEEGAHRLRF